MWFGGKISTKLTQRDFLEDFVNGSCRLQKALEIGLKPIVVVNKVDKPNFRPEEVYEMVFDLMFSLNATEDQLDFPVVYGSAKNGWMGENYSKPTGPEKVLNIYALVAVLLCAGIAVLDDENDILKQIGRNEA